MAIETYRLAAVPGQYAFLQMSTPERLEIVARALVAIGGDRGGDICIRLPPEIELDRIAQAVSGTIRELGQDECIYIAVHGEKTVRLRFIAETNTRDAKIVVGPPRIEQPEPDTQDGKVRTFYVRPRKSDPSAR